MKKFIKVLLMVAYPFFLHSQNDCFDYPEKYWRKMGVELPSWLWEAENPQLALYESLIGCKVPNFSAKVVNRESIDHFELFENENKNYLMFFGITGCASVENEAIALKIIFEELSNYNDLIILIFISFSYDELLKEYPFMSKSYFNYDNVILIEDIDYTISKKYMINNTSRLLVDKDFHVFSIFNGGKYGSIEFLYKNYSEKINYFLTLKGGNQNTRGH